MCVDGRRGLRRIGDLDGRRERFLDEREQLGERGNRRPLDVPRRRGYRRDERRPRRRSDLRRHWRRRFLHHQHGRTRLRQPDRGHRRRGGAGLHVRHHVVPASGRGGPGRILRGRDGRYAAGDRCMRTVGGRGVNGDQLRRRHHRRAQQFLSDVLHAESMGKPDEGEKQKCEHQERVRIYGRGNGRHPHLLNAVQHAEPSDARSHDHGRVEDRMRVHHASPVLRGRGGRYDDGTAD